MKNLMVVATLFMSLSAMAQGPSIVRAPVDHLFVPSGFDNNDNVEVVVTGKFENPCFTRNKVEVSVNDDIINIEVSAISKEDMSLKLCEDLKVPFSEIVSIGSLQAGDYKVVVNDSLSSKLVVNVSSSNSVDEHLYAQIDYVELGFTGGASGDAVLVGKSLSPCMVFDKVKYISNEKDTYSILPIMKKISSNCPEKRTDLRIPVKFNANMAKSGSLLLFVRSIEGKSVISFIDRN